MSFIVILIAKREQGQAGLPYPKIRTWGARFRAESDGDLDHPQGTDVLSEVREPDLGNILVPNHIGIRATCPYEHRLSIN